MPDSTSPAQSILEALGYVLFARDASGELRLLAETPPWLTKLWPALQNGGSSLRLNEASPFLENFLIDAEECWKKAGDERAQSGPWIEQDAAGEKVELDATALTAAGQPILLLERLGKAFEARKAVLQHARETVIANQRLNSEIQKKEILLHCVADEMTSALANIITSLRLIELEDNGLRTKQLLGLATRATEQQQTLIHRILSVFEDELRGVYGSAADKNMSANWNDTLHRALDSVAPLFEEKDVRIDSGAWFADNVTVSIEPSYLERVIINLLESALERSSSGSVIVVSAKEEADALLVSFEDRGVAIAPEICENVFTRFELAGSPAPSSALRLHFCRIVIENSGGEIGYASLPGGGSRFWIRLTKSREAK